MSAIAEETEEQITPLNFGHKDDLPYTEEDEREYQDGVDHEQWQRLMDAELMGRR